MAQWNTNVNTRCMEAHCIMHRIDWCMMQRLEISARVEILAAEHNPWGSFVDGGKGASVQMTAHHPQTSNALYCQVAEDPLYCS